MTLGQAIGMIEHVSLLQRKAHRVGVKTLEQAIGLAVNRGCKHYDMGYPIVNVKRESFSNKELVIFLLLGNHDYNPTAIRVAAQLMGGKEMNFQDLWSLAVRERVTPILSYLIECAREHASFINMGKETLVPYNFKQEVLPHWTRFMSIPGVGRGGIPLPAKWLVPDV